MLNKIKEAKTEKIKIIIFGCTELGINILDMIRDLISYDYINFFDNNQQKQNLMFHGVKVLNQDELNQNTKDAYFILASLRFYNEMKNELMNKGDEEHRILLPEEILEDELRLCQEKVRKRTPRKNINFIVDLAEHCNLNCQNCDHFSPLASEHFTDIDMFNKDLKRMAELFPAEEMLQINLEGGEPLLNKDIVYFIESAHRYFPKTTIQIFTNGILLPKMDETFWKTCCKYGVVLEITKYPIKLDYQEIELLAIQHQVEYRYYNTEIIKTSMHKPLDLEGKQDKYENFENCYMANGKCVMLKEGKLYPCTLIPNLETFNHTFHKNLKVTDKDYIDIYSDVTAEEIYEFLSNPTPACKYCKVKEWTYGHKWGVSRKCIEEWT